MSAPGARTGTAAGAQAQLGTAGQASGRHDEAPPHPGGSGGLAAVLTVSDRCARGEASDESGPFLCQALREAGFTAGPPEVVADEPLEITRALLRMADEQGARLVLTTGGTGLSPRDRTPEATRPVLERDAPGIAEALRADSLRKTPHGMLSRGLAGTRRGTLIVNLPGSLAAVRDAMQVLRPVLPHALALVAGGPASPDDHHAPAGSAAAAGASLRDPPDAGQTSRTPS